MTTRRAMLCLSIAVALASAPARAEPPAGERKSTGAAEGRAGAPRLDPATLGKLEAILDFCARVSGHGPFAERSRAVRIVGGTSEQGVADARKSPVYKASYDEIAAELAKVPKDQAQRACGGIAVSIREER